MTSPVRSRRGAVRATTTDERGFTLIELLIVMVIVPIIIAALSVSLISVFSLQSSVASRLGDSANSQVVTLNFTSDIQGAVRIITGATPTQCGTGTQILGVQRGSGTYVSYDEVLQSGSLYSLVRNQCANSGTPDTPGVLVATTTLAYDVAQPCAGSIVSGCLALTTYQGSTSVSTSSWTSTQGITGVRLDVYAAKSNLSYTVVAEPLGADSTNPSNLGTTASVNTCGFALPGTGTYARSLCFFDFLPYVSAGARSVSTPITEFVPGGYVFTADLNISTNQSTVQPSKFPTYSAAFLGNAIGGSPFYTGVGCPTTDTTTVPGSGGSVLGQPSCIDPAIYMYSGGSSASATVTLSNITLKTSTGAFVTGYEIVTAAAETTDANPESIQWSSNVGFNQVPDTPTSPEGNACSLVNPNGTATGGGTDLTPNPINNATTVTCNDAYQEPSNSPRTGTVVLDVAPPANGSGLTGANGSTTMTATLASNGGKQAVSFGLLLP